VIDVNRIGSRAMHGGRDLEGSDSHGDFGCLAALELKLEQFAKSSGQACFDVVDTQTKAVEQRSRKFRKHLVVKFVVFQAMTWIMEVG